LVVGLGKLFCCLGKQWRLRIPGIVREIGDSAFSDLNSLRDLSFEEGILKVGGSAFSGCSDLEKAAFPASLTVSEVAAFYKYGRLDEITFAVNSRLQYIRTEAFSDCPLDEVLVPASVVEIDPSAFSRDVWQRCVTPLFSIDGDFILSADSRTIIRCDSFSPRVLVGANIAMIGPNAFQKGSEDISRVLFERGGRLREIGSEAFLVCCRVRSFSLPGSVETIGDRCFAGCELMETFGGH
jgi:hypothetical protein